MMVKPTNKSNMMLHKGGLDVAKYVPRKKISTIMKYRAVSYAILLSMVLLLQSCLTTSVPITYPYREIHQQDRFKLTVTVAAQRKDVILVGRDHDTIQSVHFSSKLLTKGKGFIEVPANNLYGKNGYRKSILMWDGKFHRKCKQDTIHVRVHYKNKTNEMSFVSSGK